MEIILNSIGIIHTAIKSKKDAPIQSSRSDLNGMVEIYPDYKDGLDGVEGFSHIYLLYFLHQSIRSESLRVKPFLDEQTHGVFATRYPVRPNSIGLSIVRLERMEGNTIFFTGADMLDDTPLLDIKPYIPEFDVFEVTRKGWYETRKYQ